MATFDRLATLPLEIESYELEPLRQDISSEFTRHTTVIRLLGAGEEGIGEDVTYDPGDQQALQAEGPTLPLAGSHTLDSFSKLLDRLALFPSGPSLPAFADYRRWAYESAGSRPGPEAGAANARARGRPKPPARSLRGLDAPR